MLSVSFACIKSRKNKAGQSPIQLWVNAGGRRVTTLLSLWVTPKEFQKVMKSKQNPAWYNNVGKHKIEFYANYSYMSIIPTSRQFT